MANKKFLDKDGLDHLVEKLKAYFSKTGALIFQGTAATVAGLPALTGTGHAEIGDVYMFTADATTSADFVEGAGKLINQYDEVVCVNTGTEALPVLKWQILGPVFDVTDKLTFGTSMPASPAADDTFLYLGNTTYTYDAVSDPPIDANPKALGWYEYDSGTSSYVLSDDEEVQSGTTYFVKNEEYVKGVIYVYSGSAWVPQSSGDIMVPITNLEIDALFD